MSTVERQSISVSLCGHAFVVERPVRATARKMLREIMTVRDEFPKFAVWVNAMQLKKQLQDDGNEDEARDVVVPDPDPASIFGVADFALDFLYRWFPDIRAKKKHVDEATELDLMKAFGEVCAFVGGPFAKVEPVPTGTSRPESTN